nr:hypothetical protein [Tanacetum cinerariifolium]
KRGEDPRGERDGLKIQGTGLKRGSVSRARRKHMDALVDDRRKKVNAPLRKISIWSGKKADSLNSNVVFSPDLKLHYFDRDDMEFEDFKQVVKEAKHENASSKNG